MAKPTRWGFMGTGKIASDFATAMRTLPEGEHQLVAVSAGDLQRAQEFASKFNAKYAFEGYEKLANCPEVDVVYVNGLNPMHIKCVKVALNAGKNVLCEKPMGMNLKQAQEMINLAHQKKVFFMEAFWSRCFPVYDEIRHALQNGLIGEPKVVQITFGFQGPDPTDKNAFRLFKKQFGGSAVLDIGCYTIMFSTMVFNGQRPQEVKAAANLNEEGVDITACVTLKYANGGMTQLAFSMVTDMHIKAAVFGSKGKLEVGAPFYAPTEVVINSETISKPLPVSQDHFNYPNSVGLSYEAQHVRQCLLKGLKESPLMPLEHSEVITSIIDEIRRQVGVVFEEDAQ